MIESLLLRDILRLYPAQPATAVWRAVEIGVLLRFGMPTGHGLDLGCGDGKLTALLLDRVGNRSLVGIGPDPLKTVLAQRLKVYEAVHTTPGANIPELDACFDFVISNSVLEHIPNLEPVLHEVARLLRPGGRFVFTVPGPGFHANLRGSLLPWVSRNRYLTDTDKRLAHLRYPSSTEWGQLCSDAGLTLDGCLGYLDRSETQAWETISRFTGGLLYAAWGKRRTPIRIQRDLGLRQWQGRVGLPLSVAMGLSTVIRKWMGGGAENWSPEATAGCLLIHGTRA